MLQCLQSQLRMIAPVGNTRQTPLPLATLWYKKVGGRGRVGNHGASPADLPAFLQRALLSFQDQERMEIMDEGLLQEHTPKCLGDFLFASSLTMTKMQKLKEATNQDAV